MTRKEETELTLFLTDHVGNLLQYSCLENPMDRGAWWATVHGITVRHNSVTEHTHIHMLMYKIKQKNYYK